MTTILQLTDLEVAAGFPFGEVRGSTLPLERDPVRVLEQVIATALEREPCVVSFSGGRDSSAVLAVACRVARAEGLALPIPITLRFPDSPEADEAEWQDLVVRHLKVPEWTRLEFTSELDLIGPVARDVLQRHGLLWPPNTHFHVPILEHARGGSVLTGIDGDGVFASWRWQRLAQVLAGRARPRRSDLRRLALGLVPSPVRRAVDLRSPGSELPWLRPHTQEHLDRALASESAREPMRWHRWVPWYWSRRGMHMVLESFGLLAAEADVVPVHPFAHPRFLGALASHSRILGPGDRTAIMRLLSADVLPGEVVARRSKAVLNEPFWNRHSREFAAGWGGDGVDSALVDPEAVQREWLDPSPHAAASTLLQAAWLAGAGGGRGSREVVSG